MKDAFSRYTNDVIASCAFGTKIDSLREPDNEFYLCAKYAASNPAKASFEMIFLILQSKLLKLNRLYEKIDDVMKKSNCTPGYDDIINNFYSDAIFTETLRLHATPFVDTMCKKDFKLSPSLPDSKPFILKANSMEIVIPVWAIHRGLKYIIRKSKSG